MSEEKKSCGFSPETYAVIKGMVGSDGGIQKQISSGTITLSAAWTGPDADGDYSQVVTVTGAAVTEQSVLFANPTPAVIRQLLEDGVAALTFGNTAGTLTAYAIGAAPSAALTIDVCVAEVA